jgi:selenocysteine lyase/cysteine desulfurase
MVEDAWNFQREDWTPAASARRFEAGSPNSIGQAALHASVRLLLHHGPDDIGGRVLENTDYLVGRLGKLPDVRLVSRAEPGRRSGIVTFAADRLPATELNRRLAAAGMTCAVRGSGIRVSPHFYQGEEDIASFIDCLEEVLAQG